MLSYFNTTSFARAKKNKDDLEKKNPQKPILGDEDEKFLGRVASSDEATRSGEDVAATTKITDDGQEKIATQEEQAPGQTVVPETQPDGPEVSTSPMSKEKKSKNDKAFELPSQEEAEAATRGWNDQVRIDEGKGDAQGDKRTWASYLPSMTSSGKLSGDAQQQQSASEGENNDDKPRTWAQYASAYTPSIPALPASWKKKGKDKDSDPEPVYNEDGTVDEEKTREKQEKEVSVLLDNLNMSAINNRVFALNQSTQNIYDRFAQVLKDTIHGGPTACEDMEKLMKEAGPQLEKQFESMPPFVQTLVKSLPTKLGATLGPEVLAAASEKPGADMQARLDTASKGEKYVEPPKTGEKGNPPEKKKSKRTIPGMKSLISKEGAVAGILRNTVNFIQTRFPFLASTTNVVMSLAVFILMFVFWYCHKRGKEVRLAKAVEAEKAGGTDGRVEEVDDDDEDDDEEIEATDDDDAEDGEVDEGIAAEIEKNLNQPQPSEVPLPEEQDKKAT
ncbi:Hypothetical predicted protein [Lecanosticta acicola]|uniref:Uncharacterized protein n=1 Tax=Lecanosticta acicola TaxID=111012 RepID=A0AAI8Z8Z2_9PEZI|nr:Hypothetical predicted protein [Lecanosticta acicola]